MAGTIATIPKFQFSANGVPMVGGTLDTYIAGSTTPATTWQDSALTIANTNPISLDARGECVLWLDPAVVYKFVLKNAPANGGVVQWTQDNISNPAALVKADLAASSGASLVGCIQPATGAVLRTVLSKLQDSFSIKDFGAVGDGIVDDTAAIQAAFNAAKTAMSGRSTIIINEGVFRTTAPIVIPDVISIVGRGYNSVIRPSGCDAFTFAKSDVIAPRRIADFHVYGDGTPGKAAFRCNISNSAADRITGIVFDNLYCAFFEDAFDLKGAWHCRYTNLTLNNCHRGITFRGQCVKNYVAGCSIIKGTAISGATGERRAVSVLSDSTYLPGGTTTLRPESVALTGNILFGYDIAVYVQSCLYFAAFGNDLDGCFQNGFKIETCDGGCAIRDNWIAADSSTTLTFVGVTFVALGAASTSTKDVANNNITGPGGNLPTRGIYVGSNNNNVRLLGNTVSAVEVAAYIDGALRCNITGNSLNPTVNSIFLYQTGLNVIRDNYLGALIQTHPSQVAKNAYGWNDGVQTTEALVNMTIDAGATSVSATLAALGLQKVDAATSRHVAVCVASYGGTTSRGEAWATCDGTNLTVYVGTAFGVSSGIDVLLKVVG